MSMKFENITKAHEVEDWEFLLSGGVTMPITVDEEAGDRVNFSMEASHATFFLAEKPSNIDPDGMMPFEEIFVPMSAVLCVRRTRRTVEPASVEQKEEWQNLLRDLANNTHTGN